MPIIKEIKIPFAPIDVQKQIIQQNEKEEKIVKGNKELIEIYTQKIQDSIKKFGVKK